MSFEQTLQTAEVPEPDPALAQHTVESNSVTRLIPRSELSFDEYMTYGNDVLAHAIELEKSHGIDVSAPYYREAGQLFMGARHEQPLEDVRDAVDPVMLLKHALCLSKQAEATTIEPYGDPVTNILEEPKAFDKRAYLLEVAEDEVLRAWQQIDNAALRAEGTEPEELPAEALVGAALLAGAVFEKRHEGSAAGEVYKEAESILDTEEHPIYAGIVEDTTREAREGLDPAHTSERRFLGEAAVKSLVTPRNKVKPLLVAAA